MPGPYDDIDPNRESQYDGVIRDETNNTIVADLNAAIARDPRVQAWIAQNGRGGSLSGDHRQAFTRFLQQAGYTIPDQMEVTEDGRVLPINHDLRNRILTAAMIAPLFLPGGGAGVAGGTGATGTGGGLSGLAGSSYTVPSATLGTAGGIGTTGVVAPTTITGLTTPGVGTVATTPGVTATVGSTGGKMSLWDTLLGNSTADKIKTGLNLAGNLLQSRQVSKATQAQVDAANRALDLQRDIYTQQRSDLAGFADVGRGAISDMGRMTGTTPISAPTHPQFQMPSANVAPTMVGPNGSPAPHDGNPNNAPVTGTAVPRGSMASLGGSGFVNMVSPDGRPARVPSNQVQAALAAGGKVA